MFTIGSRYDLSERLGKLRYCGKGLSPAGFNNRTTRSLQPPIGVPGQRRL